MRKILTFLLLSISFISFGQSNIPPSNETWVVDSAHILDKDDEISKKLLDWENLYGTGVEYAIVTVNSLEGYSISSYASEIGYKYGIGKPGSNNDIVILIAPNEREVFLYTGYGIEYLITSVQARNMVNQAFSDIELHNTDYDGDVLKLIDLVHQRIGKMSEVDREEQKVSADIERRRIIEENRVRSEDFLFYFFVGLILIILIGFAGYKISTVIRIRSSYIRIKQKVASDVKSIISSDKIISYLDTDLIKEMLDDANKLNSFLKSAKPINSNEYEECTYFMKEECTALINKYNKSCSLITTKGVMENDINNMIEFLSKWELHPEASSMIKTLQSMVGNIKLTTALTYSYDNISTKYSALKNEINIRKDIEDGVDISKYIEIGEKARVISKNLSLNFENSGNLELIKNNLNVIETYKKSGEINSKWELVKEMWIQTNKKLDEYYTKSNEILSIEAEYKNALKNIPNTIVSVSELIYKCANNQLKEGINIATKMNFESLITQWNKTRKNTDGLTAIETIKTFAVISKLQDSINVISEQSIKEHKKYLRTIAEEARKAEEKSEEKEIKNIYNINNLNYGAE